MSETASNEGCTSAESVKPVQNSDVVFPPFPEPTEEEFEEDICELERNHYRTMYSDINKIKTMRLHCSACDRHLGSSTRNESRMRAHPMLRTLVCHTCHTFYNSGEFEKGDDGSELYCRWCGQGGQVYCCSDCPHVFCAKCIKRNLGTAKIKEIENTDDWKCFKCNPKCLWDLRALCWALLRYCDLKNKITYKTEDPELKEKYQKDCATDHTECCKNKPRRREKETMKKKDEIKKENEMNKKENETKKVISKIPSTIQVKKFASINIDEVSKERKGQKRPAIQENKGLLIIKNPITIAQCQKNISPTILGPPAKKPRMPVVNPVRFAQDRKPGPSTYTRVRPRAPSMHVPIPPLVPTSFNGLTNINNAFLNNSYNPYSNISNMMAADNINLSLENLTQGLDMVAVANMNRPPDDDVVCTPDFPLEPLCEVTEDNTDDDVQCMTPGPVAAPKPAAPAAPAGSLPDVLPENIIQMTDNDVTVNAVTGGLKFRVDPQTLSSNKMYRLPDGRIFAIKANPSMPGGYSATIVAVTEAGQGKFAPKGATYAAKLSAVTSGSTPPKPNRTSNQNNNRSIAKKSTPRSAKVNRGTDTSSRECDLSVPVEWYRYNLIDAIDAVEYSLARLNKLKKEATSVYLRTRNVDEMRNLHRTLERLLNTSSTRFMEIKDNLNKELKQYILKKSGASQSEDDDDVEILMPEDNDDPIFIDENSMESTSNDMNFTESQEVDLTGVGSSDHNDSTENDAVIEKCVQNAHDKDDSAGSDAGNISKGENDSNNSRSQNNFSSETSVSDADKLKNHENKELEDNEENQNGKTTAGNSLNDKGKDETDREATCNETDEQHGKTDVKDVKTEAESDNGTEAHINGKIDNVEGTEKIDEGKDKVIDEKDKSDKDKSDISVKEELLQDIDAQKSPNSNANNGSEEKVEDAEMSEEMIETLLKDDNVDEIDSMLNNKVMEVTESL